MIFNSPLESNTFHLMIPYPLISELLSIVFIVPKFPFAGGTSKSLIQLVIVIEQPVSIQIVKESVQLMERLDAEREESLMCILRALSLSLSFVEDARHDKDK